MASALPANVSENSGARVMNDCDLSFTCKKVWSELDTTGFLDVKHCASCQKNVHLIDSPGELDLAKALGRCVAFEYMENERPIRLVGEPGPRYFDKPSPTGLQAHSPLNEGHLTVLAFLYPRQLADAVSRAALADGQIVSLGDLSYPHVCSLRRELRKHDLPLSVVSKDEWREDDPA